VATVDVVSVENRLPDVPDALVFSTGVGVASYILRKITGRQN